MSLLDAEKRPEQHEMSITEEKKVTGLTKRALAGTGWSTISTVGKQLLTIASVLTVARRLDPNAYGLMYTAAIVTAFISNFRELGTAAAIVQRPSVTPRLLSTLFWVNAIVGLLLCIVVYSTADYAAVFFHQPILKPILQVLSSSLFLASCGVVHNAILTREMSFKALAITDLTAAAASYLTALTGALLGWGVWSLVWASVMNSLVSTIGYWLTHSYRPRLHFNGSDIRSVARFSSNLSGFGLINYLYRTSDNFIISKRLGSVPLGFYGMAYNLMLTPIQNISSVLVQVLFPAFARIQDDDARFREGYKRACMLIALITFPVMAGMGAVADPLIRAVLTNKFAGSIPIFQILAPVGLVQSINTTVGIIYQSKARTDWMLRWGLVVLTVCVTAFLIGSHYGATGVAAGYAIAFIGILTVPSFAIPLRLIGLSVWDFGKALVPQLLITAVMVVACLGWLLMLDHAQVTNNWLRLVSATLIGALVYCGQLILFRPSVLGYVAELLRASDHRFAQIAIRLLLQLRFLSPEMVAP